MTDRWCFKLLDIKVNISRDFHRTMYTLPIDDNLHKYSFIRMNYNHGQYSLYCVFAGKH